MPIRAVRPRGAVMNKNSGGFCPWQWRGDCNNINYAVCAHIAKCWGEVRNPSGKFDQVRLTVVSPYSIYRLFEEAFKKPLGKFLEGKIEYWRFAHNICLSARRYHGVYLVRLEGDENIARITKVLLPHQEIMTMLRSVEIAWDIPFDGDSYDKVECRLRQFVKMVIPKNHRAQLNNIVSDKKQYTKDGAINGKETYYYESYRIMEDGKVERIPSPFWHCKIYAKSINNVWHIRIELRLKGQSLSRRLEKRLTCDSIKQVKKLRPGMFFLAAIFDWNLFSSIASRILRARCQKEWALLKSVLGKNKHSPAATQRRVALYLAKTAKSDWLKRRIGRGDFYAHVPLFQ